MRARSVAVEEAAQEVVAFDVVGGEDLEPDTGQEPELGRCEAGGVPAREPAAAEIARVAGKGLGMTVDGDGNVIEVNDVTGHSMGRHAMMLAEPSVGSQLMQVVGFDHVVLAVSDVERSLSWYVDVVGLAGVRVEEWRRGEVPFPSVRVSQETIIDLIPRHPGGGRGHSAGRNLDHFCLVVEATDLVAWAESAGLKVLDGPDQRFGARGVATSIYVHDPDDNTVELQYY
jgi:catechol 2,3-dioxygenase-like lactoylglutathione lyase family enzyme